MPDWHWQKQPTRLQNGGGGGTADRRNILQKKQLGPSSTTRHNPQICSSKWSLNLNFHISKHLLIDIYFPTFQSSEGCNRPMDC